MEKKNRESIEYILKILSYFIKIGALTEDTCFVGTTRVFIKTNNEVATLDAMRAERTWIFALKIQKVLRGYNTRCKVFSAKYEKIQRALRAQKLKEMQESMVVIIQKYVRRFIVLKTIVLMNHEQESKSLKEKLPDIDLDYVFYASSNDINQLFKMIKS